MLPSPEGLLLEGRPHHRLHLGSDPRFHPLQPLRFERSSWKELWEAFLLQNEKRLVLEGLLNSI